MNDDAAELITSRGATWGFPLFRYIILLLSLADGCWMSHISIMRLIHLFFFYVFPLRLECRYECVFIITVLLYTLDLIPRANKEKFPFHPRPLSRGVLLVPPSPNKKEKKKINNW